MIVNNKSPKVAMNKLNKTLHFIKKIDDLFCVLLEPGGRQNFSLFDFNHVKEQYQLIKSSYKVHPDFFDLQDFAKNYTFSYYQKNDFLNYQENADQMTSQIVEYVKGLEN